MSVCAFPDENSLASRWPRDENDGTLADTVFDTIPTPLLVLDKDLRVVIANRCFYLTFKTNAENLEGSPIAAIGNGEWSNPDLLSRLKKISTGRAVAESYEIEQERSGIGPQTMLVNARGTIRAGEPTPNILLTIEDITQRCAKERELKEALNEKELLLKDMQHRVANSLQIIASILLITARTARSDETRLYLQAAHQRVMSVASVQQQLRASENGGTVELASYLSRLCEALAASMIGDERRITLTARADGGATSSNRAISIGLIVTELVINAIKHAFPGKHDGSRVTVTYEGSEPNWRLSVSDNGIGSLARRSKKKTPGVGTTILEALAKQLDACIIVSTTEHGTTVSITSCSQKRQPNPVWSKLRRH
jgi:two-component sensor histidine kinase